MHLSTTLILSTATFLLAHALTLPPSPKRGLIHIPSALHPSDDYIWLSAPSPPTWYYNYRADPSPAYTHTPSMQFVPMLWGASSTSHSTSPSSTPFFSTIKHHLSTGLNITHVLSFNEPDGPYTTGGSNMPPSVAAAVWKRELEPLRKLGVKVGAPAVTGSERGWAWMEEWMEACGAGGCNPDFMAVHWYGGFEGLMSHVGRVTARWPEKEVWVTEFGILGEGRERGLRGLGEEVRWSFGGLDGWKNVTRYSYFGAFRSDVSNVGHNAAMLTQDGELTDIGSWYLGGAETGNIPMASGTASGDIPPIRSAFGWSCYIFVVAIWWYLF